MTLSRETIAWISVTCFSMTLVACGRTPGENEAKQVLRSLMKDTAEILTVKKISGKSVEVSDPEAKKGYQMEIEAQIKYARNVPIPEVEGIMNEKKLTAKDLERIEQECCICREGEEKKIHEKYIVTFGEKWGHKPTEREFKEFLTNELQHAILPGNSINGAIVAEVKSLKIISKKYLGYRDDIDNTNPKVREDIDYDHRLGILNEPGFGSQEQELMTEVEAEIKCLKDVPTKEWLEVFKALTTDSVGRSLTYWGYKRETIWQHKKDEVETIKKSQIFKKTEKGWKGEDGSVY